MSNAEKASGVQSALTVASADQLKQKDLKGRIEGLRGMAWAYAVLHYTGYTASGASKKFSPPGPEEKEPTNSKIMYQYLQGRRAPTRGERGKYGFDLVTEVDRDPRGKHATRWLDHPLWMIFQPDTSGDQLEPYLEEEVTPPQLAKYFWNDRIVPPAATTGGSAQGPELQIFDDFLYVCAYFRLACMAGYASTGFRLVECLAPQAAALEPVFRYVQAPFMVMLEEFFYRNREQLTEAWSK
ncbi:MULTISPECIES: hypothetical protein [Chromobacterium]|uniref:hypothetical protein n=1 Tax=Chromobacterium TaxID=535 RepID=UPI001888444D|nr:MULTISPECIES: hypothetical protein [Chromobacterium]QOZ83772.1 hypothetical protein DXT74_12295 [Chromobacterium sp. Rain0013]WON83906.1 hypothetical protein OK026_22840 [Chromobacterium haemolyticum]